MSQPNPAKVSALIELLVDPDIATLFAKAYVHGLLPPGADEISVESAWDCAGFNLRRDVLVRISRVATVLQDYMEPVKPSRQRSSR